MNSNYEIVVGLEVHAELSTKTKIFCSCKNEFGAEVNTNVCPICMGMPGTLPKLNKQVVEYAIKMGHALNCKINGIRLIRFLSLMCLFAKTAILMYL